MTYLCRACPDRFTATEEVVWRCADAIGLDAATAEESDYPTWFRTIFCAGWRLPGIDLAIRRAKDDETYRSILVAVAASPDGLRKLLGRRTVP